MRGDGDDDGSIINKSSFWAPRRRPFCKCMECMLTCITNGGWDSGILAVSPCLLTLWVGGPRSISPLFEAT